MATIVTIFGSPSRASTSDALLSHVSRRLIGAGHQVVPLVLRDLPSAALLAGDADDPEIGAAVDTLVAADALVVVSPISKASFSGLLKVFLDLLPQHALTGKSVLPLVVGGSAAHVLVVDYALRPVLTSMGAAHVAPGWFVLAQHVQTYPDGGLLIDPVAARPVAEVTDAFLTLLRGDQPVSPAVAADAAPARVSPVAGADDLQVKQVVVGDPELAPLLRDLVVEYGTRYGQPSAYTNLTEVPESDFVPPNGTFLILQEDGQTIAGGALRRYDADTAEVKRVWTSYRHRRRGLARRLMAELEVAAVELGYRRIHLTTGPRQPEAKHLYLAAGYVPRFDVSADPESIGPMAFYKELVAGAGRPEWTQPSWAEVRAAPTGRPPRTTAATAERSAPEPAGDHGARAH